MSKKPTRASSVSGFAAKRSELTRQIADELLAQGVAHIPLRELANRLATSDRMLLYYFEDKQRLVAASLHEVATRLTRILGGSISARKISPSRMLGKAAPLLASSAVSPFMLVWADISALGSRGEEPFRTMARHSVHWWLDWLENRLNVDDTAARRDMAVAILAILEGTRLLEASITGAARDAVRVLATRLDVEL